MRDNEDIYVHLRAAEVSSQISVLGELNQAMALARKLPESERKKIYEIAKQIAERRAAFLSNPLIMKKLLIYQ
jgi:hypothetical protein